MAEHVRVLREAWAAEFAKQRWYIEGAVKQLTEEQFRARPGGAGGGVNSCAMIVKHLAGNLRSRWTEWLTTDGEKADRNRDEEFVDRGEGKGELMGRLAAGFELVDRALAVMTEEDLGRVVKIRGEPHSVPLAVNRSLAHVAYHAGQVMIIARSAVGNEKWEWLTVRPGGSVDFNAEMGRKFGGR